MDRARFYASVRARASGVFGTSLSQGQVSGCEALLNEAESRGVITTHLAYILASAYHETAHTMQPITEYGQRSYFNKYEPGTKIGRSLGNTVKGDGYLFRGRGYVMITGRRNYAFAGEKLKVNLLGRPDLALDPEIAAEIIFSGMAEGWFTGQRLSYYLNVTRTDYVGARKIVNGTDKASLIAGYALAFEAALKASGYSSQKPQALPPSKPTSAQAPSPAPIQPAKPEPAPAATYREKNAFFRLLYWLLGLIFKVEK